jgi:hypothetical protein
MKLPRPRIWLLLLAVAIVAVGAASWVWRVKAKRLLAIAVQREAEESRLLSKAASSERWNRAESELLAVVVEAEAQPPTPMDEALRRGLQKRISKSNKGIRKYRRLAASAHASAVSYRRAARYPWLGVRLVEPSSDFPADSE